MSASPIIQRYLLAAADPTFNSVPLSSPFSRTLLSVVVPLSGQWTIRLRRVSGLYQTGDNSGSLQVASIRAYWQWINQAGTAVFSLDVLPDGFITPPAALPKFANLFTGWSGDPDQVASNFDQVGAVISGVQAGLQVNGSNTDAAGAHTYALQLNAVLEFENPGSFG